MTTLIRYRKSEHETPREQHKADAFDYCMDCWLAWMFGDGDRDLSIKTARGFTGDSDGYGSDSSEQTQAMETRIAVATDAMIDSLGSEDRHVLYALYGVSRGAQTRALGFVEHGPRAKEALEKKLRKNTCTAALF